MPWRWGKDEMNKTDRKKLLRAALVSAALFLAGTFSVGAQNDDGYPDLLEKAAASFSGGSFDQAADGYRQARAIRPREPDPLFGLAKTLWELEHREEALKLLEEAARQHRGDTAVLRRVADFLFKRQQWKEAAAAYRRLLRQRPDDPWALNSLGRTYRELGQTKAALKTYDRLLEANPNDFDGWLGKAEVLQELGLFPNARAAATKAAALDPDNFAPYRVLGRCPVEPAALKLSGNLKSGQAPNVILFSVDTLRADRLHCYGNPRPTSPNLDRFAAEGVLFRRAMSQSPVTAPSHMSMLTGMMPDIHLVENLEASTEDYQVLSPRIPTLAEALQAAGYRTAAFVGGYNVVGRRGFERGFDVFSEAWKRRWQGTKKIPPEIVSWVETTGKNNQPFFLFLHHYYVHGPYVFGPPEYRQRFLDEHNRIPGLPATIEDLSGKGKTPQQAFWERIDQSDPAQNEYAKALYDGGVFFADHLFGEIVSLLKKNGLYDNTLFILTADHGDEFYEHEGVGHYRLFGETLHVPLLIRFPGREFKETQIDEAVRVMDIAPTILDFLGLRLDGMQGVSFLPLLGRDGKYGPPITSFGLKLGNLRVEENSTVYFPRYGTEYLYDLGKDPLEQENLAEKDTELNRLERARNRAEELGKSRFGYIDLIGCPPGQADQELDPATREDLKSLGYF